MNNDEAVEVETGGNEPQKSKARRVWKKIEEDMLMQCMVKEHSDKWKADNGFRPGFFTAVEKELQKLLPQSNIKASPHIESKVRYWRLMYNRIVDITSLSGVGWDYCNKRIMIDDASVWDAYEEANPKTAKGMNGKSFPYYDDWVILFGKDRATGDRSENTDDVLGSNPTQPTQPSQPTEPSTLEEDFYRPIFGEDFVGTDFQFGLHESPVDPISPSPSPHGTGHTPTSGTPHGSLPTGPPPTSTTPPVGGSQRVRKRSRPGEDDGSMKDCFESWMKLSVGHMGTMAEKMGFEKDLSARRTNLPKELAKLNLTIFQRILAGSVILAADDRIDFFYGTIDEEKQLLVEAILDGKIYPLPPLP